MDLFTHVEDLDFEYYGFTKIPIPFIQTYELTERDKPFRPGCENESILRQKAGETDLEILNLKAQYPQLDAIFPKEGFIAAIIYMPTSFIKPLNYQTEMLILPHSTLRDYIIHIEHSEVDPDYDL